ncbi:MAG: efflux RND transporter periplasmic adaptor subunit [Gammaproteobacteria bacterium]|nr:efflux RND transporter periplasmic adaptor subunit [Gammaproteobacteria bacterium]
MNSRRWIAPTLLLTGLLAGGAGLSAFKLGSIRAASAEAAGEPAPTEFVTAAVARALERRPTTTSVGTVLALRSITLRNELPGTVREVMLTPGAVVEAGDVLVALDVSVEQAELEALEARAALATTLFERAARLNESNAASDEELDRARAERDVALAEMARTRAVIERKIIRAPFRARIGLADVHPGQYLNEGTVLTTLQGVADAVHVDFEVAQHVAAGLHEGDTVQVAARDGSTPTAARIVAIDARVNPATRNAAVRARLAGADGALAPGASVKVIVPSGPAQHAVAVPATALRKGPGGDHVFVLEQDSDGATRALLRPVISGDLIGDEVLVHDGLAAGELVAATGSFKLQHEGLVVIANDTGAGSGEAVADTAQGGARVVGF